MARARSSGFWVLSGAISPLPFGSRLPGEVFGAVSGGETRISGTTVSDQSLPAAASSRFGDLAIVWQGAGLGDSSGIFGRFFPSPIAAPIIHEPAPQPMNKDDVLTFSSSEGIPSVLRLRQFAEQFMGR